MTRAAGAWKPNAYARWKTRTSRSPSRASRSTSRRWALHHPAHYPLKRGVEFDHAYRTDLHDRSRTNGPAKTRGDTGSPGRALPHSTPRRTTRAHTPCSRPRITGYASRRRSSWGSSTRGWTARRLVPPSQDYFTPFVVAAWLASRWRVYARPMAYTVRFLDGTSKQFGDCTLADIESLLAEPNPIQPLSPAMLRVLAEDLRNEGAGTVLDLPGDMAEVWTRDLGLTPPG